MSQFTNLYNNGQWGYMGIGPMPAYPISMTITTPGEYPDPDSYFTCGAGENWSILAYLPTDQTKYAVMKNTTLGTIYVTNPYSPSYRIVSNDPMNYPDIPASVTVDIPTDPDAWDFYGGLTSLEGCALCMWVPDTVGSAPNGCDYVSIGETKKSWFSYEDDREEFAYTIDGNYIYAKRAERDANGNVIASVPASTSADENKVLTVDSNGDAVWATAQGGGGSTPVDLPALAYPATNHNTIRFEFESSSFDPSTDSTLSTCGTWTKVTADPNRNVWDVDTSNTQELFKNKITSSVCMCKIMDSYFNITTLGDYFSGCSGLTSFKGYFMTSSTSTTINCTSMFYGCRGLKSVEIHQLYVTPSNVANVDYYDLKFSSAGSMFQNCSALETVSFCGASDSSSEYKTVSVVGSANYMCYSCKKLRSFRGMVFHSLTNASCMFENCYSLENLSSTYIQSSGPATRAFSNCKGLRHVARLAATDLGSAFKGCPWLNSIGLVDASGATSLVEMCYGCESLSDIHVINTEAVTNMNYVFRNCRTLRTIPEMSYAAVTSMNSAFEYMTAASGANALYLQLVGLATPPSHTDTFKNCGIDTPSGVAELAQIPASWGGTGS